jgi:hypothetical protein
MKYFFDGKTFYAVELERYMAWVHKLDSACMLLQQSEGVLAFVGNNKAPSSRVVYYYRRKHIENTAGYRCCRVEQRPYEALYNSLFNGHVREFETWRAEKEAGLV